MRRILAAATAALLMLISLAGQHARAVENEPKVVTLSCEGTLTRRTWTNGKPERWEDPERVQKMGLVVNLIERTVSFAGYVARIGDANAAQVAFGGKQIGPESKGQDVVIGGEIDRITGYMDARTTHSSQDKTFGYSATESHSEMLCQATNRVF
jgi:hypothetical protein